MNVEGIKLVVEKIASDLVALANAVLENDKVGINTKIGRNTLRNSALRGDLSSIVRSTAQGDPIITALFNNYVVFLEWGRPERYKKQPPISVLKDWAAKNGIPTDADTLFAISYAIWRDGHKGRPIFSTLDNAMAGMYDEFWADELFEEITDGLDKFFNG